MTSLLILASTSLHRAQLLKNAGLDVVTEAARIDERVLEAEMGHIMPLELAGFLSAAKAREVASRFPEALVIGCDQTLELDGIVLHKPKNMDQARMRLRTLAGKVHYLHSGICLYRGEKELWRHVETAKMRLRPLEQLSRKCEEVLKTKNCDKNKELEQLGEDRAKTKNALEEKFLDSYLQRVGETVLTSVGVYQIEGLGIQLFDAIEGDYFTIIGLPLLPFLHKLRDLEIIA